MEQDCCHCDLKSFAYDHRLKETENFTVVCDVHPLTEGHLLIIPKKHLSCAGSFSAEIWHEFESLYKSCTKFIDNFYGSCCAFEHGVIGQTVFHSHVHLLPAKLITLQVIPEGDKYLKPIQNISLLPNVYQESGKYLFISMRNSMSIVDTRLGVPRFFRDRFASALGRPERGNWKEMQSNAALMEAAAQEIASCKENWIG